MHEPEDIEDAVGVLLESYEKGAIALGDLIFQLESVPERIDGRGKAWCDAFRKAWEKLEESYAGMLDKGDMIPSGLYAQLVEEAVCDMKDLLEPDGNLPIISSHC